ncbi:hypothetical protein DFJ74DRAFT_677811 [Hyaloraphidium curvatum]|nr:hypothetical protein DFJ74DRAFT_677811 [Hyaloraphidium curvatum]
MSQNSEPAAEDASVVTRIIGVAANMSYFDADVLERTGFAILVEPVLDARGTVGRCFVLGAEAPTGDLSTKDARSEAAARVLSANMRRINEVMDEVVEPAGCAICGADQGSFGLSTRLEWFHDMQVPGGRFFQGVYMRATVVCRNLDCCHTAKRLTRLPKPTLGKRKDSYLCAHCGRVSGDKAALKKCSGCGLVEYCDRDCQRADWPEHKKICGHS